MSRSRFTSLGVAVALLWLLAGSVLLSQSTSGGVNGTVRDPANAVVPGASVTLLDIDKNIARHVESDSSGLYTFSNVPPGRYQLIAEKAGFRKWNGSLVLQVQQVAVVDANLAVGDLASTVEVRAVTPVIAAESSNLATVTESARIRDLPLNGLDITQLFQLTPGVQGECPSCPQGSVYSPHVSGMNPGAAAILQDGGSIVDRQRGGMNRVGVAMDTIQEFAVDTNSSAQFSHPATITMASKSGTNGLHGDLFERFRNNAAGLRARARQDGSTIDPYKRNEFGASAGGPARIPGLYNGRDKTFWFFSYQGLRLREYKTVNDVVPTENMWNGNFSNLSDAQGHAYTIYDPYSTQADGSRSPFPGNIIPSIVGGNKLIDYLKANTPRPTSTVNPLAATNYNSTSLNPATDNSYSWKVDHHLRNNDTITGRFSIGSHTSSTYFGSGPVSPAQQYNSQGEVDKIYNGAITHVHTFSPTVVNELLLSGQRSNSYMGGANADHYWTNELGLSNPLNEAGWPTITGGNSFIWDSQNKTPEILNTLTAEDNLTWLRGKHEIKIGFHYSDERNNTRSNQQGQGRYKYQGDWTALAAPVDPQDNGAVAFTGLGMADMYLGYGSYYRANYSRPFYYLREGDMGLYVQDSWKASPRLTLNYGMRWDYWKPYNEAANRMFAMDLNQWQTTHTLISPAGVPASAMGTPANLLSTYQAAGLQFATANQVGLPSNLMAGDKGDFAPRLGIAYKLGEKSVIRGSYGMYYWTVPDAQMLLAQGRGVPLNLNYTVESDWWPVNGAYVNNYDLFNVPIPSLKVGSGNMIDINSPQSVPFPFGFTPFTANQQNARVQQWNFTAEREIAAMTSLRVTYTGNHGSRLMQTVELNGNQPQYYYAQQHGVQAPSTDALRVNPFWQPLDSRQPVGYANTNQFQVNLERRAHKGLQFQLYYVFSRSLSTSDANEGYSSNPGLVVPDANMLANGVTNPVSLAERLKLLYSNVAGVPKHQTNWNFIYDLPFGRGKALGRSASGVMNQMIGGWQVAGMGGLHTGQWLTPNSNTDPSQWWATNWQMVRDPRLSGSEQKVIDYQGHRELLYFAGNFDSIGTGLTNYQPALVAPNADGSNNRPVTLADGSTANIPYLVYNSMPRNFIQGPSSWNMDLSLFKNFQLGESRRLRMTADAFNVMNHPNNQDPDLTTGLIDLGQQRNAPRIIQFSLRLDF